MKRPHGDRPPKTEHDETAFAEAGGGPFERGARAARRGVERWGCPFVKEADARAWRRGWDHGKANPEGPAEALEPLGTRKGGGARNAAQNGALTVSPDGSLKRRRRWKPPRKLTTDQVLEIRRARAAGEKLKPIAQRYGVSDQAISLICRGKVWQDTQHEDRAAGIEGRESPDVVVSGM